MIELENRDEEKEDKQPLSHVQQDLQQQIKPHDHRKNPHLVVILLKDFSMIAFTRIFSVSAYTFSSTLFFREHPNLIADFNILINVANLMREPSRFITNETKIAFQNADVTNLQKLFVTAHCAALPTALVTWAVNQSYVSIFMPLLNRDEEACEILKFVPAIAFLNYFSLMVLSNHAYIAYARGHAKAMLFAYVGGGLIIVGSYAAIMQLTDSLYGFLASNGSQNITICLLYYAYLQKYHHDEQLIQQLFKKKNYMPGFKHAFKLLLSGLQPTAIASFEIGLMILTSLLIHSPSELAAYQSLIVIPVIFTAMSATLEGRIAVQMMEAIHHLRNNPNALQRELWSIVGHSIWIGSVLPSVFLAGALIFPDPIINFLIKPSLDNQAITNAMSRDLYLVSVMPYFRMIRSAFYAAVIAGKTSANHQLINRLATLTNCAAAVTTLAIGLSLDYGLDLGALGYWIGLGGSLITSAGFQFFYARNFINKEVQKANVEFSDEVTALPASSSRFQFFHRAYQTVSNGVSTCIQSVFN